MNNEDMVGLGSSLGIVVLLGALTLKGMFRRKHDSKLLYEELLKSNRRAIYLASILDRHGIELDEFDIIAMHES
jgi:hypothetical protein